MKSFQQMAQDLSKSGAEIAAKLTESEADLWHMATGVSGEAGELLDTIKKHVVYKRELDRENVVEELGDLRFYMAGIMNRLGITEEEILAHNNAKLSKRYAAGSYSNEQATARADKAEESPVSILRTEVRKLAAATGLEVDEAAFDEAEEQLGREAGDALAEDEGEGLRTEAEAQSHEEAMRDALERDGLGK